CTFNEYDVVSGEPKVGHKVQFAFHSGGYVSLPVATKVVVDPQTEIQLQPTEAPVLPQLPERNQDDLRLLSGIQPQIPQREECYGRVKFWGAEMHSGVMEVDEADRFPFSESDIVRGTPGIGRMG